MSPDTNTVNTAAEPIREWLKRFGMTLTITAAPLSGNHVGEYESGSVFSYDIEITVDCANLHKYCKKEREPFDEQLAVTINHEVGHALVEQLIDYAENLPEMDALLRGPFGERFFDVFNDDYMDEETLVEDFAYSFYKGYSSTLRKCVEEFNEYISKS